MVDFPTPPLADDTAMTCFTFGIGFFVGRPRCILDNIGSGPFFGRPLLDLFTSGF